MDIHCRWEQEQVQHMDEEGDSEGTYGDSQDSYGGYGDDGGQGANAVNTGYQALCDIENWKGACRQDYDDAYNDATGHNDAKHGGEVGAAVLGPGACF